MASKLPEAPRPPTRRHRQQPTLNRPSYASAAHRLAVYSNATRKLRGFTILDLIAVVSIIAILVAIAAPNLSDYLRKAQEVRCMANMRSITFGLRAYLQDHGNVWPQGPSPEAGRAWEDYWLGILRPYGITDKTWQCPSTLVSEEQDAPLVHYTPTLFPPVPGIAERWSTHPWLIERGEGHGHGALICFPDGSIKSFDKVLAELGAR